MGSMRVLVADDHEIVRRGLCSLIQEHPGWEVAAEAADGREAVEKTRELKPDVTVMDISMPSMNGLEATRQIVRELPETKVLVLTMHESDPIIRDVLDAGARGYLLKTDAGRDLVSASGGTAPRQDVFYLQSGAARSRWLFETRFRAGGSRHPAGPLDATATRDRAVAG